MQRARCRPDPSHASSGFTRNFCLTTATSRSSCRQATTPIRAGIIPSCICTTARICSIPRPRSRRASTGASAKPRPRSSTRAASSRSSSSASTTPGRGGSTSTRRLQDKRRGGAEADAYGRLLCEELKPFIDATYRTLQDPHYTGHGGSSLGGLVSLYLGLKARCLQPARTDLTVGVVGPPRHPALRARRQSQAAPALWLDIGTARRPAARRPTCGC